MDRITMGFNEAGPVKGRKLAGVAGGRAAAAGFNEAGPVKGRKRPIWTRCIRRCSGRLQ